MRDGRLISFGGAITRKALFCTSVQLVGLIEAWLPAGCRTPGNMVCRRLLQSVGLHNQLLATWRAIQARSKSNGGQPSQEHDITCAASWKDSALSWSEINFPFPQSTFCNCHHVTRPIQRQSRALAPNFPIPRPRSLGGCLTFSAQKSQSASAHVRPAKHRSLRPRHGKPSWCRGFTAAQGAL